MPADRDHPGERDADLDAAFAEIVAGWDVEPVGPVPSWPASEDVDPEPAPPTSMEQLRLGRDRAERPDEDGGADDADDDAAAADTAGPPTDERADGVPDVERRRRWSDAPTADAPAPLPGPPALGPRDHLVVEPEDHFEPPEPPPIPRGDLLGQLAWAGLLLGPTFLLFAALFWRDVGRLWIAVAAAAFVGGFVALVVRLPQSRGEDDDDGAVV